MSRISDSAAALSDARVFSHLEYRSLAGGQEREVLVVPTRALAEEGVEVSSSCAGSCWNGIKCLTSASRANASAWLKVLCPHPTRCSYYASEYCASWSSTSTPAAISRPEHHSVESTAGPQGREGWKQIIATIVSDLGEEIAVDHHHLIAEGEIVVDHMTMHGRHQVSTMPLLAGTEATTAPVAWTFIHIWRVVDGIVVEHWACRDDVGLLRQIGAWPARRKP